LLALVVLSGVLTGKCAAEGLTGYLEGNYNSTDTETVDATGEPIETKINSYYHRYSITLDKKIYPNLGLLAGGFFEKQNATLETEGTVTDSTSTKLRPFVSLNMRTPLYFVEAAYHRNDEKQKTSGVSPITTVRETYSSTAHWRPDGFPDAKFEYFRTNNFDKDRRFLDTTDDRIGVTTQYRPVNALYLRYQGTIDEKSDRLNNNKTDEATHNGKVTYSDQWWNRRISVHSDYNFVRDEIKTNAGSAGEVSFRLFPFAGLSAISDTPEMIALDSNPLLVDGDLIAGAGINLGLPPPGGDARSRNIGLDFVTDTEVNTLFVSVDRDVTQVAESFSWRVYTSADNLNWVFRQTVFPAVFSSFFLRFEIRFANVTARYVKVVVSPLSPTTPFASGFPTILITELQAEVRRPAAEVTGKRTTTTHLYNLSIRTRILDVPSLFYEFSYFLRKIDPSSSPSVYTVSNGLAFQHRFTSVFSGRARVAREDGRERDGTRSAYLYTASVAAVPLETLQHSLVFSGSDEAVAERRNTAHSLFLYNIAKLYEGIDVNFGGGISRAEEDTGRRTDQTQVNASATLVPHPTMTFNLIYTGISTKATGGEITGERTDATKAWETDVSFTPVRTVYLFGSYRIEDREQGGIRDKRNIRSYTVNWSPFPDGTLHLNFYYNEILRSENDARDRSIVPSLRWNVTARSYLDLSYQSLRTESAVLTTDSMIFSGTVRIGF
jgi:hypothetical protein